MGKSARLSLADARTIWRLAGECRELGDDRVAWRRHWIAGLAELVDADYGMAGEMAGCLDLRLRDLGVTFWWRSGMVDLATLAARLAKFRADPGSSPTVIEYFRRYRREPGRCLGRNDFIAEREWSRTADRTLIHEGLGLDKDAWCSSPIPGAPAGETSNVILHRAFGRRDFGGRQQAILREAQATLAPHVGGSLARFAEPSPSELSPSVRRVLACLLQGDGDKQIAARLELKPHTVNEYAKAIFRHFGVRSRAELLARWLRRGWGAAAPWADAPEAVDVPEFSSAGSGVVATFDARHRFQPPRA
ncbi:helix-turn-helix transcriptional regulator [Paludisphaera rhizosphaerae]|uniref:helix-turn-helix transcriptional regulator n=1 Tax=Paludisphaera rhizosphaerae TaxID=2711216 RepID=UPI0013EA2AA8|nr:helix-turn-helix transcriptional regulator [Paludisphaera rhizosphaerae]